MPFLFIGMRRSMTAIQRGWTWADGRLAGRTLREALVPLGLCHGTDYLYRNLWTDNGDPDMGTLPRARQLHQSGWVIVALGLVVSKDLTLGRIPHLVLTHPAARGAIRRRAAYHAHVREVLGPSLSGKEE